VTAIVFRGLRRFATHSVLVRNWIVSGKEIISDLVTEREDIMQRKTPGGGKKRIWNVTKNTRRERRLRFGWMRGMVVE